MWIFRIIRTYLQYCFHWCFAKTSFRTVYHHWNYLDIASKCTDGVTPNFVFARFWHYQILNQISTTVLRNHTLTISTTYSHTHYLTGKLNEVDKLYKWILDGFEQFYGFSHPETLSVLIACTDLSYEIFKLNALKSEKADTIVVSS